MHFFHRDVSHLILINPLVESLFSVNDAVWQKFWYDSVVPKWYSYAIGSAVGINRIFMMLGIIKPQLTDQIDDISIRQVGHERLCLRCLATSNRDTTIFH
jgi:hypothetical protein